MIIYCYFHLDNLRLEVSAYDLESFKNVVNNTNETQNKLIGSIQKNVDAVHRDNNKAQQSGKCHRLIILVREYRLEITYYSLPNFFRFTYPHFYSFFSLFFLFFHLTFQLPLSPLLDLILFSKFLNPIFLQQSFLTTFFFAPLEIYNNSEKKVFLN